MRHFPDFQSWYTSYTYAAQPYTDVMPLTFALAGLTVLFAVIALVLVLYYRHIQGEIDEMRTHD